MLCIKAVENRAKPVKQLWSNALKAKFSRRIDHLAASPCTEAKTTTTRRNRSGNTPLLQTLDTVSPLSGDRFAKRRGGGWSFAFVAVVLNHENSNDSGGDGDHHGGSGIPKGGSGGGWSGP
jgi:hypothetical protein